MRSGIGSTAIVLFAIAGIICGCSSGSSDTTSNATAGSSTTGAATPPPASTPPPTATASTDGAAIFSQNCAGCHGQGGQNGKAPKLAGQKLPEAEVANTVTKGKGRMPAFGSRLSKDQIDAVAKYVASL